MDYVHDDHIQDLHRFVFLHDQLVMKNEQHVVVLVEDIHLNNTKMFPFSDIHLIRKYTVLCCFSVNCLHRPSYLYGCERRLHSCLSNIKRSVGQKHR